MHGFTVKKNLIKEKKILDLFDDLITYLIIGIIIGGRLGYIILYNLEYYLNNFFEILMIWNGGMSFHGAVFGIIVATFIFARSNKIDLLEVVPASMEIINFFI